MKSTKLIKNLLILAAVFQLSLVNAGGLETNLQTTSNELNQNTITTSKDLEKLVQNVMATKQTSLGKKFDINAARELAKFVIPFGGIVLAAIVEKKYKVAALIIFELGLYTLLPLDFASMLEQSKDKTLNTLKNLEKYISTLSPEQKNMITTEFKEKYAKLLAGKVDREKSGFAHKSVDYCFAVLDLLIPIGWALLLIDSQAECDKTSGHDNKCNHYHTGEGYSKLGKAMLAKIMDPDTWLYCSPLVLNFIQNLARHGWQLYKTSPDQEKRETLARIEKMLVD